MTRLILTARETARWRHQNPAIAEWARARAGAKVDKLHAQGIEYVEIYGADEEYLATSRGGPEYDIVVGEG